MPTWDAATPLYGISGLWALALGNLDVARQVLASIPPDAPVADFILLPYLTGLLTFVAAFGDRDRCADLYRQLLPYQDLFVCGGAGAVAIWGSVQLPLGVAACGSGQLDTAVGHLRIAITRNTESEMPPFAATAQYELAQVLARRGRPGDRNEAAALAVSAASVAARLGMAPLLRSARALTAALSGRPVGVLTARERDIAGLVAEGLTNRQIAAARHVSARTAENHVQHILTKLGFATPHPHRRLGGRRRDE